MPVPFRNSNTGQIETFGDLTPAQVSALQRDRPELRPALPEEVETAASYREHSTALEQLKGAAELGASAATFGQLASDSPESKMRRTALRQESPFIAAGVEQLGAAIPAAAIAAGTVATGGALGLSAAATGALAFGAESLTMGTAVEASLAREEARGIDIANIIQGLGLDVATAGVGRAAKGLSRRLGRGVRAVEDLESAATDPATAIARGNRISKERRASGSVGPRKSVGAAGAKDLKPKPPERAEVQDYARNHEAIDADVDELGYDSINDAIGGDNPAFDAVHNIGLKRGDIAGRMNDADPEAALDFMVLQSERGEELATKLDGDGAKQAAAVVRGHVQRLADAMAADDFVERAAIELDQMKRTLDRYRTRYGAAGTKAADPLRERVQWIDDVLDPSDAPLRKGLEDRKTWGKVWADKQLEENRLWSGSDSSQLSGLINTSKVWMRAFAEPHSGIRVRRGLDEVPVFKSKGDLVKLVKGMNARDFDETMNAFDTWVEKAKQMNAIKAELGVDSISRTPIARLETALDRMARLSEELKQVRKLEQMSEPLRKHMVKMGEGKAITQVAYEAAREMPVVGQALKAGEQIPGVREKISNFLEPSPASFVERPTVEGALARTAERARKRREGWMSERAMTPKERAAEYIRRKQAERGAPKGARRPTPNPEVERALAGRNPKEAEEIRAFVEAGLLGKTLKDLNALPLDKTPDASTEFLRKDSHFHQTGNVKDNFGSSPGGLPQIMIWDEGGVQKLALGNGRHRLGVAQERGMPYIVARIRRVNEAGDDVWEYTGPVRVSADAPSPQPSRGASPEAGFTEAGAMAGAGALGLAGLGAATFLDNGDSPMTDALAELSDHSRALTDRAALGLVMPDSRPPRLPPVIERFVGDAPNAQVAFTNAVEMLMTAHTDPAAFVGAMTDAFGDMGAGGHDDLAQRVIARTAVAVEYLLANLPPSLANSVTRPEGAPIDQLAIAQFSKMWSGAFRPGDVIYDVGTGKATPTQIRALREVHPDIYTNLRAAVIRAIGEARSVPFETKRQLDVLFDIDGAAGASFGSAFSKTMATARTNKGQTSQSLSGESAVAPQSANKLFSTGPSAIR